MPLTLLQPGEVKTIVRVSGNEKTKRHLENLGFVPGATVSIIQQINGNVIVNLMDSRIAISCEMANKIHV